MLTEFRIVITGALGTGKGTQAPLIASAIDKALGNEHPMPCISSGTQLRKPAEELVRMGFPADIAPHIRGMVDRGEMVDADLVHLAIGDGIGTSKNWLVEAFPRSLEGSRWLHQLEWPPNVMIVLRADRDCILARAADRVVDADMNPFSLRDENIDPKSLLHPVTGKQLFRRPDDAREVTERRLALFATRIQPSIDELVQLRGDKLRLIELDTTHLTREATFEMLMERLLAA